VRFAAINVGEYESEGQRFWSVLRFAIGFKLQQSIESDAI